MAETLICLSNCSDKILMIVGYGFTLRCNNTISSENNTNQLLVSVELLIISANVIGTASLNDALTQLAVE